MIKPEYIDDLISKFLSGEASPEEAMQLDDWKAESDVNLMHYISSEKVWLLTQEQDTIDPNSQEAWKKVQPLLQPEGVLKPIYKRPPYLRIAAIFIGMVMIGIVGSYIFQNKPAPPTSYISGNQPRQVKLMDGSDVTLSPNTRLEMNLGFDKSNRTMRLYGTAYFSVKHKDALPFIIDAGGVFIKDIGTRFSVRSSLDTDTVYVHVDEGIVLLFDSLGTAVEIRANGHGLYIKSKRELVTTPDKPEIKSISFTHATLGEVIGKLNTMYHTSIVIENNRLKECAITTQFNGEDLETVLGIIVETLGVSYEKTASGYLIKGNSCHS